VTAQRIPGGRTSNQEPSFTELRPSSRNQVVGAGWWTETLTWGVIKERGDDIAKVSRTLIGMDEEHARDFILYSIKNQKPMEAGKSRGNVVASTKTHH